MEEKGEAVTIYAKQSDGSYKLDKDALGKILNQEGVADLPIMIVSVAGAMREGKSFLLNLFIKYLESGRNEQWLSDDSKLDGFHWQGGAERDTVGILMWSKPYFVEDEYGKKVAVLLMETQGAFDNEHDMGQSTKIFTMSLMMCSVQIYNVMQSLRADKLNFFELFLEHAKMVKQETKENVFQSLMFLVRDWPYQEDHDFGSDGGTMYVKKQLERFSKYSKIKKKDFKNIFNHYEGFLLPHPGEKFAEKRSGVKDFSDMNEEFARYVRKLVKHLFRSDNIVKKAITGTEIIGRNLLPYAESIGKLLENENMPQPKDLVEAQIQAHCSSILDECTRKFHEKMTQNTYRKKYEDFFAKEADLIEKKLGQNFEKWCVLAQEIQEACLESAEEMKRKLTEQNFGVASFNDEFVKKTEDLGEKLRESLTRKNGSELAVAKTKSSATDTELAHFAKTMLLEELDKNVCSTKLELNQLIERVKDRVWKKWEEKLPDYPDFVTKKLKRSVQGKLEQLLAVAEERNNKDKFSRDTSRVLAEVRRKYNEEMEKRLEKKSHDKDILEEFHRESFGEARITLEQKDIPPKLKKSCMEKIEVELAKELRKVEKRNDERTETFKTSCRVRKSNCVEIARKRIKEKCDENVLSEDQITSVQAEAAREARTEFRRQRELGSKSVYEKHETEMNAELEKLLSFAKKTNKEFEEHFLLTQTMEMKNAKKEYKKAMLEKISGSEPVKESVLVEFHKEISANTEDAFMSKLGKLPLDVENECRKRLQDTIKHAFSHIQRQNQQKKRDCETKEKQTVAECLEMYNAEMSEATKGKILQDDEMDSNHKAANIKATDKLNSLKAGSSESTAEKMEESLRRCIEERYEYFKQDRDTRKKWAENKVSDRMVRFEQMYQDQMDDAQASRDADYLLALAKDEYLNHMREKCGSVGVERTVFSNNHGQAKVHGRNFINGRQAKQRVKDLALQAFESATENLYSGVRNENDARLRQAEATVARKLKEAKDRYEDIMANYIKSVCCCNLQLKHDEVKKDLKRQDANVTDHLLSGLFNYYQRQNSDAQAERKEKYKRIVNEVFSDYKLKAHQQWRESDEKKWFFTDRKLKNFKKHHPDIKNAYINQLRSKLPPRYCPSCPTCKTDYIKMLNDKIDEFKSSQIRQIEKGGKWTF